MTAPSGSCGPARGAEGILRARFTRGGKRTQVFRSYEAGGYRLRFPNVVAPATACEAVCINTGGGMVGGDTAHFLFTCDPGATATVTTQSAEKMYRSLGTQTRVEVGLEVAQDARLDWVPQDTILFDGVDLARALEADIDPSATLLIAETLVFGRLAMGETVRDGRIRDRWRIRRGGRLLFAEDLRLAGPVADTLDRAALGGGARALATLVLVAPAAEAMLAGLREALAPFDGGWGASAWNGLLTMRAAAPSPERVRGIIVAALANLRGQPAPRVWQ